MNKTVVSSAEENEYRVVNLEHEYPDFIGGIKWAIVTDLNEADLEERFGEEIDQYRPFVILSNLAGEVFKLHKRNDNKFEKRSQLFETLYAYEEGTTEIHHDELVVDTLFDTIQAKLDREELMDALSKLTPVQKRRVEMFYFEERPYTEIAAIEGADWTTVRESMRSGLKKLKKLMG